MALVELRNVSKSFTKGDDTIQPLDGVNLDIEEGDFVSLMGPSGTGKSTLLNVISGIDQPDEGTITVDGVEITKLSRSKLADWRAINLGYIFQTHNLIPVLTTYENVELPTLLLKLTAAERRQRVQLALQAVGLSDRARHYPRQLSGGQEQRVGIARAIVAHPKVVVADEPTGSLDTKTSEQIQSLLQRLNRELNITMLLVTHDSDVAKIASRQLRLDEGKFHEQLPGGVA
ncbi:ABC transporter ATP-binding protein [Mariniblastus fucicola]|uniref:ABC transporter ATP-binding protein YtrE n=1 Tax=Mariniblastus fucicola TaxID=980251 RepID=A0A5B9P9T3_9BACT|nr:ABC transporter ATP-binding protein [Mariniblastus fucicola]QEG23088.1 ABC transporter ATP-binding protein YtrE [Mariniblastus fucicola]